MKKTLTLALAIVMIISMFAGCGPKETANTTFNPDFPLDGDAGGLKFPLADNNDEIVWSVDSTDPEVGSKACIQGLREATGVNLKLLVLPTSTAGQKINVLAASNDLPDIVGQGLEPDFAEDLCMQGAFAAVQDYMDILPNFRKIFVDGEGNWIFKSRLSADGKLYGFYGWDFSRDVNTGAVMYRKDIFDKHGVQMWNSPETFYQALKKLKEAYPESTPYTIKSGDGIFQSWSYSWGMKGQEPYYEEADGKWYFTDTQPEYKEMLDFMLKCYNEGLIDPEFLTNTQAAWTAKMTQADKAFVTTDWIGRMEPFKEQTANTVPDYDLRFANPIGPDQTMPTVSQLCWPRHVSAQSKNIETCFKLLDFCLSPAGRAITSMGIKGVTYDIGEDGMAKYIEFTDKAPTSSELTDKYGTNLQGIYLGIDRRCATFQFSEREQEAQDYAKDPSHMAPRDPELVFTAEENARKNELIAVFLKAGREFATKYILNNGGEKEWNEWLKEAERLGYKELEKIYNDAQTRFDAQ